MKKSTRVGCLAVACTASSSSSSSAATRLPSTAWHQHSGVPDYNNNIESKVSTTILISNKIPRGGHSPSAAAAADDENDYNDDDGSKTSAAKGDGDDDDNDGGGEKKKKQRRRRKKKSSKHKQTKTTATGQQTDDDDDDDDDATNIPSTLPPAARSILEQTCHYDVLGITKCASQIEIQKAYRRRCVVTHPDKIPGGDRAAFDKVSYAYDVLRCENKRAVYDKFGHEGIENGVENANGRFGGGGGGMSSSSFFGNDVFRDFFGSSSSDPSSFFFGGQRKQQQQQQQQQQMKNRNLRYQLEVTLFTSDVTESTLELTRIVIFNMIY